MIMESDDESPLDVSASTSMDTMESILLDSSYGSALSQSLSASDVHPLAPESTYSLEEDPYLQPFVHDAMSNSGGKKIARKAGSEDHAISLPLSTSSSSFSEYLTITVSQPQTAQETESPSIVPGRNTYVTYLIVTRTNIPQYGRHEFMVRRRFRDVIALANRLSENYKGYFVPSRPDKNTVESQVMHKQEFIEHRRAAIEKYLHRLANHHVIRLSDELRSFLQSDVTLPSTAIPDRASNMIDGERSAIMAPQDVVQTGKTSRDIVHIFKGLRQSVSNEWAGVKHSINEEEKEFLEKKKKLEILEHCLGDASKQAEGLIRAHKAVGDVMGEFGLAFIKLAKFETEKAMSDAQGSHAADTKRLGTAVIKANRFYRDANIKSAKHMDQLHEYLSLMQSVHSAFNDRSTASIAVQTLFTHMSTLNARIEKLKVASSKVFGGDEKKNVKVEELKEALENTRVSCIAAAREYQRIKGINRNELERFDSERQRGFLDMIKGLVHTQVRSAEQLSNLWSTIAEEYSIDGNMPYSPGVTTSRP